MFNIERSLAAVAAAMALSVSMPVVAADDAAAAGAAPAAKAAEPVDVEAAEALARREDCFKCHTVEKPKDGPAFKKIAAKYKPKPDAHERLLKHITTGEIVKLSNGDEEEHRIVKSKDEKELANMVRWILSR